MKTKVSKGTGIIKERLYFEGGMTMLRLTARGILINRNTGRALLIKYLDKHSKSTKEFTDGFWVLPGSGVKKHETFEEAVKREIHEEMGITNVNVKNCAFSRIIHAELRNIEQNLYYERYYVVETDDVVLPLSLKMHIDAALTNQNHPIDITDSYELLKVSFD